MIGVDLFQGLRHSADWPGKMIGTWPGSTRERFIILPAKYRRLFTLCCNLPDPSPTNAFFE